MDRGPLRDGRRKVIRAYAWSWGLDAMTSNLHTDVMAKQKSTYYLTEDIRAATKLAAVAGNRSESDVVEEALRRYLRTPEAERGLDAIRELMDRVSARSALSEDEAMGIANEELHAMRAARRQRK